VVLPVVDPMRRLVAEAVLSRVAGADRMAENERIFTTPGPRWFAPDRPVRHVHADVSMLVGGLRALLLQALHPLAMAAVADHSGYRGDPWGRLQRTSTFVVDTTFATAADAEAAVRRVRAVHTRISGVAPDGRPYDASDPHLLEWVHLAEVDSFLRAYQRYGTSPLDQAGRDAYVEDMAFIGRKLGIERPPSTEAELRSRLRDYRPELESSKAARDVAQFLVYWPPVPLVARPAYGALAAAAVGLLPRFARWPLRLPYLPVAESTVVRAAGAMVTRTVRWAMPA
jgi:uncharacterized protein (DUF2236 family)